MQMIYTDGVSNVALIDGVVRLDLMSLTQVENEKAQARVVGSLAVSLPALLRIHDQLAKVVEDMVQKGVLTKREPVDELSSNNKQIANNK
jgi:hypothetical protein